MTSSKKPKLEEEDEDEESSIQNDRSEYMEKLWTKDDGTIDGYSFRGKRLFAKALVGLRATMEKKGVCNEINSVKFKPLDSKLQGAGLEIDVKITYKNQSGIAILKIYGPKADIKKDNTVTITKSKNSDSKYVVLLAEKIVKPLMNGFLDGDLEIQDSGSPEREDSSNKKYKCNFCEKVCKTTRGLKGHITRMHFEDENNMNAKKPVANKRKSRDDNIEVVVDITKDDKNEDDTEFPKTDTQSNEHEHGEMEKKKYTKTCEKCEFEIEANKKYLLLRKISLHKDNCISSIKCLKCNKRFQNKDHLKFHVCDKHKSTSISKSPPSKKKRADDNNGGESVNFNKSVEEMDIDDFEKDKDNHKMEVDVPEENKHSLSNEKDILAARSKYMDDKIIAKEKKNMEEEMKYQARKALEDKKKADEIAMNKVKMMAKKQKLKNVRKKKNKKQIIHSIPNLKEVPKNCAHLVGKDYVVYQIPGDGACAPNCGAAFLFEDEVFGHKLRKNMNNFFADHFYEKYQYISQCSPGHPFERQVKGQIIKFTDPEDLIKYLKTSEDANYMWSDSEDLAVLSDMYQMRIKIITTKGEKDENPTENWIYPDKNLEKDAEIRNVDIQDMILLHTNDVHFDLIVPKESKLATVGSLSYRNNIGPMLVDETPVDNLVKETEEDEKEKETVDITVLLDKIEKYKESKARLEKQYEDCEKELRVKTEELEKLKIENRDLKQIVDLGKKIGYNSNCCDSEAKSEQSFKKHMENLNIEKQNNCEISGNVAPARKQFNKPENINHNLNKSHDKDYNCSNCEFNTKLEESFKKHIENVHKNKIAKNLSNFQIEEEFNCEECFQQYTSQTLLNKHINLTHRLKDQILEEVIRCKYCGEQFGEKWNMMNHRKQEHPNTVALCKNNLENKCKHSSEMCWWKHEARNSVTEISCFICSETFKTKGAMMLHRKKEHKAMVSVCTKYQQNNCRFISNQCWFLHEDENMDTFENKVQTEQTDEVIEDIKSVFQKANKPPLKR